MRSPILYFLVFSFSAVSWIVLLSGVSSVQYWCGGGCRDLLGIPWWLVWFQFLVFCGLVCNFAASGKYQAVGPKLRLPTGERGLAQRSEIYKPLRAVLLSFLTMASVLSFFVADRALDFRGDISLSSARVNTAAAGAIMTAIFDMLFIIMLCFEEVEGGKPLPQSSHVNMVADPPLPPMPATRPATAV